VGNASGFLPGEQLLITCRVVPPEVMETLSPKMRAMVEEGAARAKERGYNQPQWRMNSALIVSAEDGVITLDRPLRADLPLALEPYVDMNYNRCALADWRTFPFGKQQRNHKLTVCIFRALRGVGHATLK
jgi:hypothetical protein